MAANHRRLQCSIPQNYKEGLQPPRLLAADPRAPYCNGGSCRGTETRAPPVAHLKVVMRQRRQLDDGIRAREVVRQPLRGAGLGCKAGQRRSARNERQASVRTHGQPLGQRSKGRARLGPAGKGVGTPVLRLSALHRNPKHAGTAGHRERRNGCAEGRSTCPHAARACRCCSASALWCMSTHREARKKRRMKWSGRGSSATAPMSPHTDCSACGTAARARAGGMREATRCGVEATGRCPRGARQGAMARCARAGSQHGCVQWHGQRSGKSGQQAGRRVPAGAACGGQRGHAPARRPSCRGTLQQMPPAYAAPRPSSPCGDEEE